MKKLLLLMLAVCLVAPAFSQNIPSETPEFQKCASFEHEMEMREKYAYLGTEEDFEAWLADKIDEYVPTDAVTTIPIIFHIIHNGESVGSGTNLSNTYINAQVTQLNNDYRRVAGTSGYNNNPVGADSEIEFTIAEVRRYNRSSQGWTAPPFSRNYLESTIKPQTYADPDQYLNFWVANLSGGLLGYAQFPSQSGLGGLSSNEGPANTDGVVCLYTSLGSTTTPNPNGGIYGAGRTATHEIGHYLGLRHIWGDGGCSVDDYVSDTPTSDASNFNCPTGHVSCSTTDMVENYMDYTQDTCMNIFTQGQKTRMQTVLANALRRGFSGGGGNPGSCATTISSFPYSESFESGTGAWAQASGDDLDWTRDSNGTPSSGTGPSSGSAGSWYMYIEASSPNYPSKNAIFNSPCFDLSGESQATLTFDYHMNGNAVGTVSLQASTDGSSWNTEWTRSGSQGSAWNSASVNLDAYAGGNLQLRFNGTTGSSWQGDIAVDDLNLSTSGGGGGPGNSTVTVTINTDNYPGETTWEIRNSSNQVVASGGPYGSQGSTEVSNSSLASGNYTFTIFDSYGDGICCGYGNGSYTVTVDGSQVASGGNFGSSESTNFSF